MLSTQPSGEENSRCGEMVTRRRVCTPRLRYGAEFCGTVVSSVCFTAERTNPSQKEGTATNVLNITSQHSLCVPRNARHLVQSALIAHRSLRLLFAATVSKQGSTATQPHAPSPCKISHRRPPVSPVAVRAVRRPKLPAATALPKLIGGAIPCHMGYDTACRDHKMR